MRCSNCKTENPAGKKFCGDCGAALANLCPKCGADNPAGKRFCGECGAALSANGAAPHAATPRDAPDGERRHLTVLFCDLVNSTGISAHLDPEDWHDIAADYQRTAAEAVTRLGGHVAKYLGDGLVVYFGYPQAHEDDAERAVRAGLAIIETMAALNDRIAVEKRVKLAVRVGIHTGSVVVGQGGGKEADVFGDAPNVASRVQQAAEPDTVVMTAAVHDLVSGRFVIEDRGEQQLKGIEQPVRLFRAISSALASGRGRGYSARELTPFVGREDEMHLLLSRWERVREGGGQFVLVMGEPGIGKTRLMEEFRGRIKAAPHLWIECAGGAFFANTPFHPVTQMLNQGLGWRGDGSPEERVNLVEQAIEPSGVKLAEAVPLIAEMLNLPVPQKYPPLIFSPEQRRKRLLAVLAGWVFSATLDQPLILVMEDLHWVDPSTLELIQTLVEEGGTAALMLLCTARLEFRAPWTIREHHAQINLNRLDNRETRELVSGVISRAGLTPEMLDAVIKRTDGVPLFAEELTRLLLEGRGRSIAKEIPATLQDSLMARLDRLGPAKEVAQVASVIGREFSYRLLHSVLSTPEDELQSALTKLVEAELLYARGIPPEATYQFKHALIQDAAYEALLKSKRKELHLRVARIITDKFPAVADAQPEILARHWSDAGEAEAAVAAWTKAARAAEARHAFKEAEEGYRQALAMLGALPGSPERDRRELELTFPFSLVLASTRGPSAPEPVEAFARGRALAEKTNNLSQLVLQVFANGISVWTSGDITGAIALADQILDLARREGSDTSLRLAHWGQFMARYSRGDLLGADQHFTRWRDICEASGYDQLPSVTTIGLAYGGRCAWALGEPDKACKLFSQATAFARDTKSPYELAVALFWESDLFVALRDPVRAEAVAARALAMCDEGGFRQVGEWDRVNLGWARAQLGKVSEGVAFIRHGIDGLLELKTRNGITGQLVILAEAQALNGALTDALSTIENALQANPEEVIYRPEAFRRRGELRFKQGHALEAEADFREATALAQKMSAKIFELRATMSLARLLRDTNRCDEARSILAEIYDRFTEGFDTADLKDAKALLVELGT